MAVAPSAFFGVSPRGMNGRSINLYPNKFLHQVSRLNTEETNAAISINEKPGPRVTKPFANRFDQLGQQEEIILEKGIARHMPPFRRNPQHDFQTALGRRV